MVNVTKIIDYALVYLLVAFSGVPFFYKSRIELLIVCLLIPLAVFIYRKQKIDKFFVYYIVVAILIQAGQMLKFYYLPFTTFLGLHVRLIFAYLTIKSVGNRLIDYYIQIMLFSIVSSLVFYFLSYIPLFEDVLINKLAPMFKHSLIKASNYAVPDNVILYTIKPEGEGLIWLKRNSGPIWEPGAFAGFLIIALLFNIIKTQTIFRKSNQLIIAGIISTFSTAGLMVLGYIILSYYFIHHNLLKRFIFVPLVLLGCLYVFVSVDFIGDKVFRKLSFTDQTYNTRFKSAKIDFVDFLKSPVVGLGRTTETRFEGEKEQRVIHRNNGVTNFLAMYGGIVFLLYFRLIFKAFKSYCLQFNFNRYFAWYALGAILLIGFSQEYFTKVFFLAISMMVVISSNNNESNVMEEHS